MVPLNLRTFLLVSCLAACGGGDINDAVPDSPDAGSTDPSGPDSDNDGLSDDEEASLGTDPNNPDSDADGLSDGDEIAEGTDPLEPDSDGDGILDGDEILLGTDPTLDDLACAETSAVATQAKKPVDIVLVIDTSSSMAGEIDAVESNLDSNLAEQLELADVDYRIILLADHGNPDVAGKFGICINSPLSGHDCATINGTDLPENGDRLKHYPIYVGSHDAYDRILSDFALDDSGVYDVAPEGNFRPALDDGYGVFLREEALKVFLLVTDDDAIGATTDSADGFDQALLALSPEQFGTSDNRNYVFHTIMGMTGKSSDTSVPWLPADPVQLSECGNGDNADGFGAQYQESSKLTGGLRFPLCDNANFDAVFQEMAVNVTEGVALECAYKPAEPAFGQLDFGRVVAYFHDSNTGKQLRLERVESEAECADQSYYVASGLISLCPSTCNVVKADPAGSLDFHVACSTVID